MLTVQDAATRRAAAIAGAGNVEPAYAPAITRAIPEMPADRGKRTELFVGGFLHRTPSSAGTNA